MLKEIQIGGDIDFGISAICQSSPLCVIGIELIAVFLMRLRIGTLRKLESNTILEMTGFAENPISDCNSEFSP